MNTYDGSYCSVKNALNWTIGELLLDSKSSEPLTVNDIETNNFWLYQDPEVGWCSKEGGKLGDRAHELKFRYCSDKTVELVSQKGVHPLSKTAQKTTEAVVCLLSSCCQVSVRTEDIPSAQPQTQSDWCLTTQPGWISKESLNNYYEPGKIRELLKSIAPAENPGPRKKRKEGSE